MPTGYRTTLVVALVVRRTGAGADGLQLAPAGDGLVDLAAKHPELVEELASAHQAWADRVGVIPWEETLAIYRARGEGDMEAAG